MLQCLVLRSPATDLAGASLTDASDQLMRRYGKVLGELCRAKNLCIVTSTASRAVEAAEVLQSTLGVGVVHKEHALFSGGTRTVARASNMAPFLEAFQKYERSPYIVLITHFPYCDLFPQRFAKDRWGAPMERMKLPKGGSVLIDNQKRVVQNFLPEMWLHPYKVQEPRAVVPVSGRHKLIPASVYV